MTIIITFIDTKTTSWGLTALNLRKQQGRATESLITSERERERKHLLLARYMLANCVNEWITLYPPLISF